MFVQDAGAWIVCRMIIGLSLATFVCSQVWCAQVRQDPPPARSLHDAPFQALATTLACLPPTPFHACRADVQ